MVEDLVDNLHALRQSDAIIGRLWLAAATRRFGLLAFAGLIAIFGLGMTNVAGFYALLASAGPVWAAAIVAAVDFALAVMVVLVSRSMKPDREIERAFDARSMALESIRADVTELKGSADAFVQDIRDAKDSLLEFAHDPLDSAVQKLLNSSRHIDHQWIAAEEGCGLNSFLIVYHILEEAGFRSNILEPRDFELDIACGRGNPSGLRMKFSRAWRGGE